MLASTAIGCSFWCLLGHWLHWIFHPVRLFALKCVGFLFFCQQPSDSRPTLLLAMPHISVVTFIKFHFRYRSEWNYVIVPTWYVVDNCEMPSTSTLMTWWPPMSSQRAQGLLKVPSSLEVCDIEHTRLCQSTKRMLWGHANGKWRRSSVPTTSIDPAELKPYTLETSVYYGSFCIHWWLTIHDMFGISP